MTPIVIVYFFLCPCKSNIMSIVIAIHIIRNDIIARTSCDVGMVNNSIQ